MEALASCHHWSLNTDGNIDVLMSFHCLVSATVFHLLSLARLVPEKGRSNWIRWCHIDLSPLHPHSAGGNHCCRWRCEVRSGGLRYAGNAVHILTPPAPQGGWGKGEEGRAVKLSSRMWVKVAAATPFSSTAFLVTQTVTAWYYTMVSRSVSDWVLDCHNTISSAFMDKLWCVYCNTSVWVTSFCTGFDAWLLFCSLQFFLSSHTRSNNEIYLWILKKKKKHTWL